MDADRLRTDLRRLALNVHEQHDAREFSREVMRRARRRRRRRNAQLVATGAASALALVGGLVVVTGVRSEPSPTLDRLPPSTSTTLINPDSLLTAIRADDADLVDLLLAAGADPNATTTRGFTPLMVATFRGDLGIVVALIEAGAAIDEENGNDQRALHIAAIADAPEIIRALTAAGADPDATGGARVELGEMSPLMAAARAGSAESVAALLGAGADATVTDATGRPTVFYALDALDHNDRDAVLRAFQRADVVIPDPSRRSTGLRLDDAELTDLIDLLDTLDQPRGPE
ncbi:MAG: ankyrin repeat domain-containing protein [Ilumatobacter sp.]